MLELLTTVFRQLLSMALTALPVMGLVLLVRALLGKAPKKYAYVLWLVVALRLVCPVTLPASALSLFNLNALAPVTEHTVEVGGGLTAVAPLPAPPTAAETWTPPTPDLTGPPAGGWTFENPTLVTTPAEIALEAAALIWVTGLAVLAWWGVKSYLRLRRQVATAVRREDGVWECDAIPTPFVLGLFRPNIYIPFRLSDAERTYVLAHERHHIARRDHWTKPLALLILAVYWWDPAVWLCWVLYCRDMEMSCDEAVLSRLGNEVKADYSRSLVSFALDRSLPTALAFGEHDATRRVRNILDWQRARPAITFLGIAAVVLTLVVCGTGAQDKGTWLRREDTHAQVQNYSYSVSEEASSFVFYREVYEYGVLTGRDTLVYGDFDSTTPKKGEFAVRFQRDYDRDDILNWSLGKLYNGERGKGDPAYHLYVDASGLFETHQTFFAQYEIPFLLPEQFCGGGMGHSSLGEPGRKIALKPTSDTVLAAYYPHKDDGKVSAADPTCAELTDGDPAALLADTPYAIVIRVRLSPFVADMNLKSVEWGSSDLARQLYALRAENVTEAAVAEVLALLGDTTPFTLKQGSYPVDPDALVVRFDAESTVGHAAMELTALLPALFGDVETVVWSYPNKTGGVTYGEAYAPHAKDRDLTALAQWLGYKDIRDLGQYRDGIRALVDHLCIPMWMDTANAGKQPSTMDELAETLFALRTDSAANEANVRAILDALGTDRLGGYTLKHMGGELHVVFGDRPADGSPESPTINNAMRNNANFLLALVEDLGMVSWQYPTDNGSMGYVFYRSEANAHARTLGYADIKAVGQSPEAIQRFLNYMGGPYSSETDAAGLSVELLAAARKTTKQSALAKLLLTQGPWPLPEETVYATVDAGDVLEFIFGEPVEDPDALDTALARNALILLDLRPWVDTVRWYWMDGEDWAPTRTFDRQDMRVTLYLSSDSAVFTDRPSETPEALDRLMDYVDGIDGKLYRSLARDEG